MFFICATAAFLLKSLVVPVAPAASMAITPTRCSNWNERIFVQHANKSHYMMESVMTDSSRADSADVPFNALMPFQLVNPIWPDAQP